ncbi:MAG: hypothetical protein ACRDA5_14065 [Clostridium sp.]
MSNSNAGYCANYTINRLIEEGYLTVDDDKFGDFLVKLAYDIRMEFDGDEEDVINGFEEKYQICSNCAERKEPLDNHNHCTDCRKIFSY